MYTKEVQLKGIDVSNREIEGIEVSVDFEVSNIYWTNDTFSHAFGVEILDDYIEEFTISIVTMSFDGKEFSITSKTLQEVEEYILTDTKFLSELTKEKKRERAESMIR
jgi:hypothetical protein